MDRGGSDSQAAPPLWRVTAAALDVRASAARRTAGNRRQENERAAMERERKGAMPPTPTTISTAFLLPDAFSWVYVLDPYLAWLVHLMNYEGGNRLRPDMFCLGLPLDFLLAPSQS